MKKKERRRQYFGLGANRVNSITDFKLGRSFSFQGVFYRVSNRVRMSLQMNPIHLVSLLMLRWKRFTQPILPFGMTLFFFALLLGKMSIRAGTTFHDLEEVHMKELDEPNGWVYIPVGDIVNHGNQGVLRAHFLQIEVLAMHQNGRDTHIRQVKVFGPRQGAAHRLLHPAGEGGFSSSEFSQFSCIR